MPPAEHVELALARIEESPAFRTSPRHRSLLRHLVARALVGDLAALKESVLAVEVFSRDASGFDPKSDTIVRVEARRLRARLSEYYSGEGRVAELRIFLPVGTYVPLITMRDRSEPAPTATRRARDLTERGEHFLRQSLSLESLEAALQRFDDALRESPQHAPAHVGRGRAWLNLATGWYRSPFTASEHAGEALRRALELDPHHAVAHTLLAAIESQFERDWVAARRRFEVAKRLAPQEAFVRSAYGCHLCMNGLLDEAQEELSVARRLDPHYINSRVHMVNLRIAQRRFDEADAELAAMHDIAGDTMSIVGLRGTLAMYRDDAKSAVRWYERACELMPHHAACFIALAGAHALAGRHEQADEIVAETMARGDAGRLSPYVLAIFEVRRGRLASALSQLERAVTEHDPLAVMIPREPTFDALHGMAPWAALVRDLGPPRRSQDEMRHATAP